MIIYRDFNLSEILYYKIGGKAKFVLKIENREHLLEALNFVKKNRIEKVLPIGLGSNLLISDNFFDGAVLWFNPGEKKDIEQTSDGIVKVFSSVLLDDLIRFSFDNNLIGIEWAGGLPSTVGGAIQGNAGAFGGEIKDIVNIVEIVKLISDGYKIEKLTRDQLEFSYRDSLIKRDKHLLVVSAEFCLQKTSKEDVEKAKEVYRGHIEYRNKNHPTEFPSCGSVFKNIRQRERVDKILDIWQDARFLSVNKWHGKISTGYVINKLGFSGLRIGGAEVSKKHANYILNIDNARFDDVVNIIEKIKEKFYKTFGFSPEVEVEIVDNVSIT